jgi:Cu-Zn family superoxide dismutase
MMKSNYGLKGTVLAIGLTAIWLTGAMFNLKSHDEGLHAKANLTNAQNQLVGVANLTETKQGVKIDLHNMNLPVGVYAIHIHEKGFTPPNFETAGGHFNPYSKEHGLDNSKGSHAGDLPNIHMGKDNTLEVELIAPLVTLKPGQPNSLLRPGNTSLIIHAHPDDYHAQPAGNAGDRIAGGTIEPVKEIREKENL